MEEVDGLVTCVKNIYEPDVGGLFCIIVVVFETFVTVVRLS